MSEPEQTSENPYCPQGWDEGDQRTASREFQSFINTKAYTWIANYLGCKQRQCESKMAPNKPSDVTHLEFVELASRINEHTRIWGALQTLLGLDKELGKVQDEKGKS